MGYELNEGVYKYTESPSKTAVEWQGYDGFPGVDNYEDRVLKAGTELVKLEPSSSGYFTTREIYENLKKDGKVSAIALSEGLQVAPWKNPVTRTYEYRKEVSIVKLSKDIEVAYGEKTLANGEFGKGTFTQIYIAGYDGLDRANNEKIGLKEVYREDLCDNIISKKQWQEIVDKHKQHLLKRNLFCYLKCKDDLLELKDKTSDSKLKEFCGEQILEVDKKILKYKKEISNSMKTVTKVQCPTYDDKNKYLLIKANSHEIGEKNNKYCQDINIEKKIKSTNMNLMKKVEGDLLKPVDQRNINVDELLNAYNLNKICNLSKEIGKIENMLNDTDINMENINVINNAIQRKEQQLEKTEKNLKLTDQYKNIANEYDNKKIFKRSYQKKHEAQKNLYNEAQAELKASGINSWQQYQSEKTNFKTLKFDLEKNKRLIQSSTSSRLQLFEKLIPLKREQSSLMTNIGIKNKIKVNFKKRSIGIER